MNQQEFDDDFLREARIGLMVLSVLLVILVYVAYWKLSGWNRPAPVAFQRPIESKSSNPTELQTDPVVADREGEKRPESHESNTPSTTDATGRFEPTIRRSTDPSSTRSLPMESPAPRPEFSAPERPHVAVSDSTDEPLPEFNSPRALPIPSNPNTLERRPGSPLATDGMQRPFSSNPMRAIPSKADWVDSEIPNEQGPIRQTGGANGVPNTPPPFHSNFEETPRPTDPNRLTRPQVNQPSTDHPDPTAEGKLPESVTTGDGDSFWIIAQRVYGDGRYFDALYKANQDRVESFNEIPAGTKIVTPPIDQLRDRWPLLCPRPEIQSREGDTLFSIARDHLGQASRYVELISLNYERLGESVQPDTPLPVGTVIELPRQ